jgi:uncharacterized protein (DUF1697 family)
MAEKYCAFLRGVNVNGISIKMKDLQAAFVEMGFTDVQTILATGNVVFTIPERMSYGQDLNSFIEKELSRQFQYEAHVFLRSGEEIQKVIIAAQATCVPKECHNYLLLLDDNELLMELRVLFDSLPHLPEELLMLFECGAFWIVPVGSTLASEFGSKVLGSKKFKSILTSRNMNTILKIGKAMFQ